MEEEPLPAGRDVWLAHLTGSGMDARDRAPAVPYFPDAGKSGNDGQDLQTSAPLNSNRKEVKIQKSCCSFVNRLDTSVTLLKKPAEVFAKLRRLTGAGAALVTVLRHPGWGG